MKGSRIVVKRHCPDVFLFIRCLGRRFKQGRHNDHIDLSHIIDIQQSLYNLIKSFQTIKCRLFWLSPEVELQSNVSGLSKYSFFP